MIAPIARTDLQEIWRYIARDSVNAADRVAGEFEAGLNRLAEMPGIGHTRPDVGDTRLRFWSMYTYLIAYSFDETELRVFRVVSGYRDLKQLFKRG